MVTMPIAGRLTDRYGPRYLPAAGLPLVIIGLLPFVIRRAAHLLRPAVQLQFVQGLGMGLSMMPTMTAAMQAVPPAAIARTSTAMNIIRQAGASIGTAILSVILASAIASNLGAVTGHPSAGAGAGGLGDAAASPRPRARRHRRPAGHAFSSTFVWALVLLVVALVPAVAMALVGRRRSAGVPVGDRPLVLE